MQQDDETLILPTDIWWPLRVEVSERGDPIPFHAQLLYAYQWRWTSFAPIEDTRAQADGSP